MNDVNHQLSDLSKTNNLQIRQNILDWLSPLSFSDTQQTSLAKHQKGTCEWLLNSHEFQSWRDDKSKSLWCPGIPGAGKTIASAILIDHLQRMYVHDRTVGIAFLYFRSGDTDMLTIEDLLASILKQLAQAHEHLSEDLEKLYLRHSSKLIRPSPANIISALQSETRRFSKFYILIDALDEYPDQARAALLRQLRSSFPTANVLITSRPLENIARQLRDSTQLEVKANIDDLRLYIKGRIYESTLLSRALNKDPYLEEDIIDQVTGNAKKMYAGSQTQPRHHIDLTLGSSLHSCI